MSPKQLEADIILELGPRRERERGVIFIKNEDEDTEKVWLQ